MSSDKTYEHGPRIHEVAGQIITYLLDYGEIRGSVVDLVWRPATVRLAEALFQDEVLTNSAPGHEAAYTRYFTVMSALDLLEETGLVKLAIDLGQTAVWKITLVDGGS